jgi:lactoylglutathione lyase
MSDSSPVLELRLAITVSDYAAALRFWRDALGLPMVREFGDGDARGGILDAGRATIEIVTQAQADAIDRIEVGRPLGAALRLAMEVEDSTATAQRLASAGGENVGEAVTTPWGHRNVRLTSPEGLKITLFTIAKD